MTVIGLLGSGHMGAGLGWALREGGADVVTTLAGRSERSARFAERAGVRVVADVDALVRAAHVVLVVTPPAASREAATELARAAERTGARPLVADLNSIAPATTVEVARILDRGGLDLVGGSISGGPPWVRPGARIYLSGPRSAEVAGLAWQHVTVVDLGQELVAAKAVKMSTASVYKGLVALYTQAMRTAQHGGVLDHVLADLQHAGFDLTDDVAVAAAKADRYVGEMHEIAAAQADSGLEPALFAAFASVWADIATSALAADDPETARATERSPDEVVALLSRTRD